MATSAHTTNACPRLSGLAPRITSTELLALLDPQNVKRRGTIRAAIVRHVPKLDGADLGLSPVIA